MTVAGFIDTNAQTISGIVTDKAGDGPIVGAHAIVICMPDRSIAAYAMTDANGRFSITKNIHGVCLLRVSCIGYANEVVPIKKLPSNGISVQMTAKAFNLKEVAVKRRAPGVVVRVDTVKYKIERYTDGTEQVLGEVLDKLPGVRVTEGGKVTAGGKLVDKLLINGQDFAGEKHELLTKNLPSEMVKDVELLKNYNEYSILEGFKSKGTAINIGVDSSYTRRPTGNAELHCGYKGKYRAKGNLFFIGDQAMLGVSAKAYNTGEETMSIEEYLSICGGVKNFADAIGGRTTSVERPSAGGDAFLKADIGTRRRNDQMVTANVAWNPDPRLNINAYAIINREGTRSSSRMSRSFFGMADTTAVRLDESGGENRRIANVSLNIKLVTSENGLATYRGTAFVNPDTNKESVAYNDTSYWNSERKAARMDHDLTYSHKLSDRQLLTIRAYAAYDRNRADVTLTRDSSQTPTLNSLKDTRQERTSSAAMCGGSLSYIHHLGTMFKLRASLAYDADRTSYESESQDQDFRTPKTRCSCGATTLSLSVNKTRGKIRLGAGAQLVNLSSPASRLKWKVLPQGSVEFHLSKLNTLELSYESSLTRDTDIP